MKKTAVLILCIILSLSFAGCGKKDPYAGEEVIFDISDVNNQSQGNQNEENTSSSEETTDTETSQESSSQEDQTQETVSGLGFDLIKAEGYYFPDVNMLYSAAAKVYYEITSGNLPVDWDMGRYELTNNGSTNTFWRINDSRFDSVSELEEYLNVYFTEDFIKTFYNSSLFCDYDGHLYAVAGVSSENILFAGYNFVLTKQTTKRALFECTSYFYKSIEDIPENTTVFTGKPDDETVYDTKTTEFVLETDESGFNWKFSQFGNIK